MPGLPLTITPGEPAGIGPDLLIQLCQQQAVPHVLIANAELLRQRAGQLGLQVNVQAWQGEELCAAEPGNLWVHDVALNETVNAGLLSVQNAKYVIDCLDVAIDGCLQGRFGGMVTGPVHKGVINEAGLAFSGHTEYLQERCGVERVVMMLATDSLRVALATTHLPLRDVAATLTQERLRQVLHILLHDLRSTFGITRPKILVAGLNPHAGEGGHLGREEIEIISPVLAEFGTDACELLGPLPADTLFTPKYLDSADAVLAMYHDQGLPVLKFQGFGRAVNITLGLPIVRTSVDHGTALDLAGTGRADIGSLQCALTEAAHMAAQRVETQEPKHG